MKIVSIQKVFAVIIFRRERKFLRLSWAWMNAKHVQQILFDLKQVFRQTLLHRICASVMYTVPWCTLCLLFDAKQLIFKICYICIYIYMWAAPHDARRSLCSHIFSLFCAVWGLWLSAVLHIILNEILDICNIRYAISTWRTRKKAGVEFWIFPWNLLDLCIH